MNKKLCKKCKYHGKISGDVTIHCNYAGVTGETCIRRVNSKKSVDLRGDNKDTCLLFEEDKPIKSK